MALSKLSNAIRLAVVAHDGQVDHAGQPYILHPLRVMQEMETEAERIIAVLHDVLEDSTLYTAGDIRYLFGDEIGDAVVALTREPGEIYAEYIDRCRENPLAAKVKLADLMDNISPARRASLNPSHKQRYDAAIKYMKGGDA